MSELAVIGIAGDSLDGLSVRARGLIDGAEIIFGSARLLALLPHHAAQKEVVDKRLGAVAARIREGLTEKRMVLLASGDPGCYGIAAYLNREIGPRHIEVIPAVSSVQLAFARINRSWHDARLLSVHGREMVHLVPEIERHQKVALLTDAENNPARIARALLAQGATDWQAYLCENPGLPGEKVTQFDLQRLAVKKRFAPLNVLLLLRAAPPPSRRWGAPEAELAHRGSKQGLVTKLEVRAVSLANLALGEYSVVWDVGAGSGAVSIDAARLADRGHVYAVERDPEAIKLIDGNLRRHRAYNVSVVSGEAPQALAGLPDPDGIFIGGSGGHLPHILATASSRLKPDGRLVLNLVTLENLALAREHLSRLGFQSRIIQVNVARGADIAGMTRFEALSPVYIVTGVRGAA